MYHILVHEVYRRLYFQQTDENEVTGDPVMMKSV